MEQHGKELFGTDDVKQMKEIARSLQEKNPRRAGRKKRFTPENMQKIRNTLQRGISRNGSGRESGTGLTIWDMKRFQRF